MRWSSDPSAATCAWTTRQSGRRRISRLVWSRAPLITGETLRLAEGYVQVASLGPINVKGLGEPVSAYGLTGAVAGRSRFQMLAARGLSKFVGRASEIEQLSATLGQARTGRGQVVAVVGEPGVGKSRLFWEFTHSHRTDGCLVVEAGSVSYGKAMSYLPVIELLRAYFQIESRDDQRKVCEKVTGKLLSLDVLSNARCRRSWRSSTFRSTTKNGRGSIPRSAASAPSTDSNTFCCAKRRSSRHGRASPLRHPRPPRSLVHRHQCIVPASSRKHSGVSPAARSVIERLGPIDGKQPRAATLTGARTSGCAPTCRH